MFENNAFNFDPFEVGNAMTIGLCEELLEATVSDAVDYIRAHYGDSLTVAEMEQVFEDFDICYPSLPHWLAERFDEFEVN